MTAPALPLGYRSGDADWDDPGLRALLGRSGAEILPLYANDDLSKQRVRPLTRADVLAVAVVRHGDEIVAAGALANAHGVAELNRIAVAAEHRRLGLARRILHDLERHARIQGIDRLRLQTGFRQEPAIALYEREGWIRIPPYGPYADDDVISICFEKEVHA